jgi:hypothetical protein
MPGAFAISPAYHGNLRASTVVLSVPHHELDALLAEQTAYYCAPERANTTRPAPAHTPLLGGDTREEVGNELQATLVELIHLSLVAARSRRRRC